VKLNTATEAAANQMRLLESIYKNAHLYLFNQLYQAFFPLIIQPIVMI